MRKSRWTRTGGFIPNFLGFHLGELLARLLDPEVWENEEMWPDVAKTLPSYRLSKIQPLMPPWVEREVVASYLLDVASRSRSNWSSTSARCTCGAAIHCLPLAFRSFDVDREREVVRDRAAHFDDDWARPRSSATEVAVCANRSIAVH